MLNHLLIMLLIFSPPLPSLHSHNAKGDKTNKTNGLYCSCLEIKTCGFSGSEWGTSGHEGVRREYLALHKKILIQSNQFLLIFDMSKTLIPTDAPSPDYL